MLQVCSLKSSSSSAVVLLSSVTGLTAGGGGAEIVDHSSMIVAARADCMDMHIATPPMAAALRNLDPALVRMRGLCQKKQSSTKRRGAQPTCRGSACQCD